ncbi:MAG: DUF4386 family protein [Anaerolineae bacterium]|nr:DUF4386 family protein [Anaerolineae bacterium]
MNTKTDDSQWKTLYRVGGAAPLIALAFYLSQFLIFFSNETYPTTPEGWFVLFQHSKLLGLFFLNVLDVFSIALLGTMFLALYIVLRQFNPSLMAIAAFFSFLGVAVFCSTRAAAVSATLSLSDQYAAATTEAQRFQILAAGQAIHAPIRATVETAGFFFMAAAGLIISVVILHGKSLSRVTAYVGILASLVTFANDISIVVAPSLATILMPINGLLWLVWWLLISRGLFRLARDISKVRN